MTTLAAVVLTAPAGCSSGSSDSTDPTASTVKAWTWRRQRRLDGSARLGSGEFWLFGGCGYDISGSRGYLNDLWKYGD